MTEPIKAYLAAMIDAEGCIGISLQKGRRGRISYVLRLVVVNSHRGLLNLLRDLTGVGRVYQSKADPSNPQWSTIYRWQVVSVGCRQVIEAVLPYLIVKRAQAEIVASFPRRKARVKGQDAIFAKQTELYRQCKWINRRGYKADASTTVPLNHPFIIQRKP